MLLLLDAKLDALEVLGELVHKLLLVRSISRVGHDFGYVSEASREPIVLAPSFTRI